MEIGEERSIPWLTFAETESGTTVFGRSRLGLVDLDKTAGSGGGLLADSEVDEDDGSSTSSRLLDIDKDSAPGGLLIEEGGSGGANLWSISSTVLDLE